MDQTSGERCQPPFFFRRWRSCYQCGYERQDALLVKEMNMNAVRSHYPPDEHFLDMCDSLGIVYMDELAGWQNGYDSKVGPKLVKE